MSNSISALVVAHNEEEHLVDCLASLSFADEIVVVLDKCTDNSKHIAARYTDNLIEGSWGVEGDRRNRGIEACNSDWVLELDADERVTRELAREIRATLANAPIQDFFYIPFDNYIGGRLVKEGWGCYWGVRSAPRLFKKHKKVWGREAIHPSYTLAGNSGRLSGAITHLVDADIADMISRFNRYTDANAQQLLRDGVKEGVWRNVRRIFSRAWKCYITRKGYKEGSYGLLNAAFAGLYPIVSYLKAKEKQKKDLTQ